ncbi:leucine-rich repeat-containing G-protein coupled receptor 4-like [Gordionus sp. m RMFG-2023]|uniref:leucine-rich repeat-containing G-protein coupled receptor 4-like n=1 Tax=Gordionus sp. m RMFG-2023 TaxID=3053472 RepID=UPI0031FD5776
MDSLETLNLSFNLLYEISSSAFKELPKLCTLDLSFNKLTYLYPGTFDRLKSLKNLILTYNNFVHLDHTVVPRSLGDILESLSMDFNDITSVPAMAYLNKLQLLDIRGNVEFGDLVFPCNLDNLKTNLVIKMNGSLCDCMLSPLKTWLSRTNPTFTAFLKCYDSTNNSIFVQEFRNNKCYCNHPINMTLAEFSKFCKFIKNNIKKNISDFIRLQNISSVVNYSLFCANLDFSSLQKHLALHVYGKWSNRSNQILKSFIFYNINFTSNDITIQSIFPVNMSNKSEFYYPQSIRFVNCDLKDTTRVSYTFFGKLLHLDLSFNLIKALHARSFSAQPNLLTLNLSSNQFKILRDSDFSNLISLTSLYLHANMITSIQEKAFAALTNLTELTLHSNSLKTFDDTDLPISVKFLYLHDNFLTSISRKYLSRGMSILTFTGNPIKCKCHYKELYSLTKTNYGRFLTGDSPFNSEQINNLIIDGVCIDDSIQITFVKWSCNKEKSDEEYLSSNASVENEVGKQNASVENEVEKQNTSLSPELLAGKSELDKLLIFLIVWSMKYRSALRQNSLIAEVNRVSEEEKKNVKGSTKQFYDASKGGSTKHTVDDEMYYEIDSVYTKNEGGVYSSDNDTSKMASSTSKSSSRNTSYTAKSVAPSENMNDSLYDPTNTYNLPALLNIKETFDYADFMEQDESEIERMFSAKTETKINK